MAEEEQTDESRLSDAYSTAVADAAERVGPSGERSSGEARRSSSAGASGIAAESVAAPTTLDMDSFQRRPAPSSERTLSLLGRSTRCLAA